MDELKLPDNFLQIPEEVNMATLAVEKNIQEGRGKKVAIYYGEEKISYEELNILQNKFGNVLKNLGISRGDHFIMRLPNIPEFIISVLGGMKIGAIPIPTSTLFREWELEHILNNSDSVLAITTKELYEPLGAVKDKVPSLKHVMIVGEPKEDQLSFHELMKDASSELKTVATGKDDVAFMLYTSGTTGLPKGIEHAHRWLIATGDTMAKIMFQLTPEDISFQPQEMSFAFPFGTNFFHPFYCGGSILLYAERFNAEKVFRCIERYKVTVFAGVPTIYRMMLNVEGAERRFDLSSLRLCVSAGETLPVETYEEWKRRFGLEIREVIGQSESHGFLGNLPGIKVKPGSMGKPFPSYIVKVLNEEGKECSPGEVGELVIKEDHPGLCLGYRKMEDRWKAMHKGGWYYCKDYAYVDEDGYFWYVSRSDDLIKSRGYLISPKEVEDAILKHPAVLEVGVVGVPDPTIGQRVKALLTLKEGFEASEELVEDIKNHLTQIIAPYKVPKEIQFVQELPKTVTGKILRRELRK